MSERKRGLGRGLGALIPTGPSSAPAAPAADRPTTTGSATVDLTRRRERPVRPAAGSNDPVTDWVVGSAGAEAERSAAGADLVRPAGAYFAEVPIDAITPNPRQPRTVFDEDALGELVHSIREIGLLQPIVVRPLDDGRYELVMGERRWRATQLAGLSVIPAIVRETRDEAMLRDALLENLHRSQLNPLEEAAAYQQLLDDFGCTHDELAQRIGRSRPQISNTIRLMKLPPSVQRRLAAGVLSAGHARALLAIDDPADAERLAARIVAEGLSVRSVEEIVSLGDLGEDEVEPRRRRSALRAPGLDAIAERLGDQLETRVRISMGKTRGRIVIDFATLEDLQRIVDAID